MKIVLSCIFAILFIITNEGVSFPAEKRNDVGVYIKFEFIKGGCFQMGNTFEEGNDDEKPVHEVCLDDFYMGKYEVTVGEFRKFIDDTRYKTDAEKGDGCSDWNENKWEKSKDVNWLHTGFPQTERHPVVCVTWSDADEYVKWLSAKEGKGVRLPTEAEWEYAARSGGKGYEYIFGDGAPSDNLADESAKKEFPRWTVWEGYTDNFIYTAPVGSFKANESGLHDMAGNVWEWTADWYGKNYYKQSPKDNPKGPERGDRKVARGGSWLNKPDYTRASHRFKVAPAKRFVNGGFRVVYPAK